MTRERSPSSIPPEHAPATSVYWMESSRRRQALEWLAREDLAPGEREALEDFVRRWRTDPRLAAAERRAMLRAYERIARRLARPRSGTRPRE